MENQRKFYKMESVNCIYTVNEVPIDVKDIQIRIMNAAQNWRTKGTKEAPYKVSLPKKYIIDYLTPLYIELVDDFIIDNDENKLELEIALIKYGYPKDLDLIFGNSEDYRELVSCILDWYGFELLQWWLGPEVDTKVISPYAINTIKHSFVEGNYVYFEGVTRDGIPEHCAYQDW